MRNIKVNRTIPASQSAVWAVLADFPNIADWNTGVKTSFATGEAVGGVGATRHCDLSPAGELEETITAWEPERLMTVRIDSAKKLPIRTGHVTFTIDPAGDDPEGDGADGPTLTGVSYDYETKWGPIGALMGPMIDSQLTKGFGGFLEDLEKAATAQTP